MKVSKARTIILYCRKQLCGTGETIQSYHHQAFHRPQVIQKHLSNDDDIDVGKVGDEVIKVEGKQHYGKPLILRINRPEIILSTAASPGKVSNIGFKFGAERACYPGPLYGGVWHIKFP